MRTTPSGLTSIVHARLPLSIALARISRRRRLLSSSLSACVAACVAAAVAVRALLVRSPSELGLLLLGVHEVGRVGATAALAEAEVEEQGKEDSCGGVCHGGKRGQLGRCGGRGV